MGGPGHYRFMTPARLCLTSIVASLLAVSLQGCCSSEESEFEVDLSGEFVDKFITDIRNGNADDEARCEAACFILAARNDESLDDVRTCTAQGDVADAPWDDSNTEVSVSCSGVFFSTGFCTGRRPQGHVEHEVSVDGLGRWFAAHAHLEQASVRAFVELADWLERRQAPAGLTVRCRAAARDEVAHARVMRAFARREGATVPRCQASPASDALLDVALHNAVEGCVHEAFAVAIASVQAERADCPEHREAFATVARDELGHGQLAWDLHAWLMPQLDEGQRAQVCAAQARALRGLPSVAAANAVATPKVLGWPSEALAEQMARTFGQAVAAA